MTIRITYDEAEPGSEASYAFGVALDAEAMTESALARHFVGNYTFIGNDADPKRGRPARYFLFEHEDGAALFKVLIPEAEPDDEGEAPPSYINSGHIRALQYVQQHPGVTLTSVRIDGEPGVAIVLVETRRNGLRVMPLFVGIIPTMEVDYLEFGFHERGGKSRNGGREPARPFDAVTEVTKPRPKVA